MTTEDISWWKAFAVYLKPRVIAMCLLGFGAGLPLLLVFSTLSAWLSDSGVSRSEIGLFAWVGITYSIKIIWAPIVDRFELPIIGRMGRRRSWILVGQIGVVAGLLCLSTIDPSSQLWFVAFFAVIVAFSSATQDIAIDAYRIEAVDSRIQGAMSASYIFGYRLAMLVAGAGSFYIAEYYGWSEAYIAMAVIMGVAVVTVILVAEPENSEQSYINKSDSITLKLQKMVVEPFSDFFARNGQLALLILLFVACYRLSDITMGIMANPFYLELGFSKVEIANVVKVFGFFMTIAGAFLCGSLVVRYGFYGPLLLGAIMVACTNVLFSILAGMGPDLTWLAIVISADNLSGGIASTAFVAYLSSLTNRTYTATQYALFSSLMTLPGKFLSGFSGFVVDAMNYSSFFLIAAALGIPAIILVLLLIKNRQQIEDNVKAVH